MLHSLIMKKTYIIMRLWKDYNYVSTNDQPEDCEVNEKLNVTQKEGILQLVDKHRYIFSNKQEAGEMIVH